MWNPGAFARWGSEMSVFAEWDSFYVIIGSAAGALIGLQFVVITLIAGSRVRSSHEGISAFGTPTVVHFAAALLTSAFMSAPWSTLGGVRIPLLLVGLFGIALVTKALRRARSQTGYTPVWEDWLWHTILPFTAYAALVVAALLLGSHTTSALFVIAATALSLLLIGIHNSWDTVTYIAIDQAASSSDNNE